MIECAPGQQGCQPESQRSARRAAQPPPERHIDLDAPGGGRGVGGAKNSRLCQVSLDTFFERNTV